MGGWLPIHSRISAFCCECKPWNDFLVLFSSITAVTTPFAESDYSGANAFLDAFAHYSQTQRRYPEAEAGYHKSSRLFAETLRFVPQWPSAPPFEDIERAADWQLAFEGRVKVKQRGE